MVVTFFHSRPDFPGVNLYFDGGIARASRIKLERAVNVFEMSANVGNHHVPRAKLGCGVSRFKNPFSHH